MTCLRGPWVLLFLFTGFLVTAAARPLGPGHFGLGNDVGLDVPVERHIVGAGLQSRTFSFLKDMAMNLVGRGCEGMKKAGEAVESQESWLAASNEVLLLQARGVSARSLLQNGGLSQQGQPANAYPGYYQGSLLVSPFLSIVMGAAICVGLCVFLSVCRVVVRHRFAQPLLFEATARQEAPSAALPYSILKGLPIVSFKKEGENQTFNQGNGDNQCPICLIEFEAKDSLRKLPECSHYFHQACVDEWFKRNHTCPLCRTSLLPSEPSSAEATPPDAASSQAQTESAVSSREEVVVPVAALEQEAGQVGSCPAPLEREGPGALRVT
ncbi:Zinc finger RING-type domain containing protein [Klebsormidium nitens]|uniref:Zinc finger RING-type domain containing protein n=1 Tax=Klebsormidium nitens TaxID=105231 RepID=A0A1Y1I358_KLENI|nr:Zinc finger RING-type domain containing protein [Klebsormidium nitens]|eukprot:GAQ84913.1 Zinc finger RING-type domain containing protein [Klebsormidium nitens]